MHPPRPSPPPADRDHARFLSGAERDANAEADLHFQKGEEEANVNEDYSAAMLHYHMALKLQRDVMGQDHPIVATTLNSIGAALMKAGDHNSASAALREALYIRQEELRDVADDVAETLKNLSILQDLAYAPKQEPFVVKAKRHEVKDEHETVMS